MSSKYILKKDLPQKLLEILILINLNYKHYRTYMLILFSLQLLFLSFHSFVRLFISKYISLVVVALKISHKTIFISFIHSLIYTFTIKMKLNF